MNQRISECDGRMGHVLTPNVERPGDRIERGQDCRIGMVLPEPVTDLSALFGGRLARILIGLDDQMCLRCFRPILPDFVDGVTLDRDELSTSCGKGRFCLLHPITSVKPGVVADTRAL